MTKMPQESPEQSEWRAASRRLVEYMISRENDEMLPGLTYADFMKLDWESAGRAYDAALKHGEAAAEAARRRHREVELEMRARNASLLARLSALTASIRAERLRYFPETSAG